MLPAAALAAIILEIIEIVSVALTAYEIYDLLNTLYKEAGEYTGKVDQAKKYFEQKLKELQLEIDNKIDKETERALLVAMTDADTKHQGEQTRKTTGRVGEGGDAIVSAIKQNIPFRRVIGDICAQADKVPAISLRRRKSIRVKDLPKAKKEILAKILEVGLEKLDLIDGIENFIVVRLKQLATSLIFEFIDNLLEWHSPLKAEACFGPAPGFADPIIDHQAGPTKLWRRGPGVNPFYPLPYRQSGSISADLAIPDYRREPLSKNNLFAVIEIKFPNDSIHDKQFQNYFDLGAKSAKVKTAHTGKARTLKQNGVTVGCRVALFRFPEDVAVKADEKEKEKHKQDKPPRKPRRRGGH